jgi:hypothetical protein
MVSKVEDILEMLATHRRRSENFSMLYRSISNTQEPQRFKETTSPSCTSCTSAHCVRIGRCFYLIHATLHHGSPHSECIPMNSPHSILVSPEFRTVDIFRHFHRLSYALWNTRQRSWLDETRFFVQSLSPRISIVCVHHA